MHDQSRDARVWDSGYLVGHRHGTQGRVSLLADKYDAPDNVIDLRQWRIEHGRCECARKAAEN